MRYKKSKQDFALEHFESINDSYIRCKICEKKYVKPYLTDTIKKHIRFKHRGIWESYDSTITDSTTPRIPATTNSTTPRINSTTPRIPATTNSTTPRIYPGTKIPISTSSSLLKRISQDKQTVVNKKPPQIVVEDVMFNIGTIKCIAKKMRIEHN